MAYGSFETYLFIDSLLQLQFPDFEAAGMLHAQITEALAGREKNKQVPRPGVGEIAPDFVSSRPDGSQLSLSDLKGNYILLHFWAGWSSLSREENPRLNEIWNLKGDFPFKILQVSLDGDRERWIQAIDEDRLRWDQVSDLERWESAIANLYSVDKIPSNYLIDPGGKIIAVDLFGGELMEKFKYLKSNY